MNKLSILYTSLSALAQLAEGTNCFSQSFFPKIWANKSENKEGQTYAIAYSDAIAAVFVGGYTADYNYDPTVMRVDTSTNRVRWRRYLDATDNVTVTAMSVNPAGDKLAMIEMKHNPPSWGAVIRLNVLRTSDGGHHNKKLTYTFGDVGLGDHYIRNGAMHFASNGMIFMAAMQTGKQRDSYAGRQMVLAYNSATTALDWIREQPNWYGVASALVYKDYGAGQANLFIGGSNDIADGNNRWVLSITRMTEAGVSPANSVFHINQKKWDTDQSKAPWIDHMHLDDTGGSEILFGSSRSLDESKAGNYIYLWKTTLDASHNPDPSNLFVAKQKNISNEGHIVGIKPTLVSGDLHFIWHRKDKRIFYGIYDWTFPGTIKSNVIVIAAYLPSFAVFGGSRNEAGANTILQYQGYIGVRMKSLKKKAGGNKTMGSQVGMVLSTLSSDSCLKVFTTQKTLKYEDPSADMTIRSSPSWQTNTITGQVAFAVHLSQKVLDQAYTDIVDDNFCSPASGGVTVTAGSATPGVHCMVWDDSYSSINFTPMTAKVGGSTCTDATPTFTYHIDTTPVTTLTSMLQMSVDSETNKIWIKGISGSTYSGPHTITVGAYLPFDAKTSSFTFQLTINSPCIGVTLTAPSFIDQLYYVTNPQGTYTAPAFTGPSACTSILTYTTSHTPNISWITGTTQTSQWQTNDETQVAIYTVTVASAQSSDGCTIPTTSGSYKVDVQTACNVKTPIIDSATAIFQSPALTQNVWDPTPGQITWSDANLSFAIAGLNCGVAQFAVEDQSGSAIDVAVFTATLSASLGATQTLTIQTSDRTKAGTFNLRVKAWFTNYSSNVAQKDFTVIVTDTCESLSLTASSLSNEIYLINKGQQKSPAFNHFNSDPSLQYCPITYTMMVSPSLPVADPNAITISSANREYTFLSTQTSSKALYTVTTKCFTPGGIDTGKSFQFTVDFQDPCMPMTIDSASSIFKSPALTQDVWDPTPGQFTWTDSLITVTDPSYPCGAVQFTIENQDGSAIDSSVFIPSFISSVGATNSLATQTDVRAKAGTHNLRVKATFSSQVGSTGQKDFTIIITDSCESPTITASSLSNTNYIIGSVAQDTPAFSNFINSPSYCPVSYSHVVSPSLPIADSGAISLTSATRKYTFSSSNTALARTYTVNTKCFTPGGTEITGIGKSFDFDVLFVDPCLTAALTIDASTISAISYTYVINAAADVQTFLDTKVSSDYSGSVCPTNFDFTIKKRDGSPFDTSIFTWDPTAQTFKTQSSNFANYSLTPIPLTAHVKYVGYADAGTLDFDVTIDIHCSSATFDSFTVNAMTHSALGAASTQALPSVQDSVSKIAGNTNGFDHCGPRVWSITTLPITNYNQVVSLNVGTKTLTLGLVGTTGLTHIGDYNIEVQVALQNYPSVIKKQTFKASVTYCVVTSVSKSAIANQAYNIYTPQIQFTLTGFTQTPACAYTLAYTFQIKDALGNYSNLPSFISETTKTFTVVSNSPTDVLNYDIAIIGAVPVGFPAFSDEQIIKLVVSNGCLLDAVTTNSPASIADLTYTMTLTGLLSWSPTWSSTVAGCPLSYNIGRVVTSTEQALAAHETAVLTHSTVDGSLSLNSNDFALDKEIWQIKLYKQSTYSTHANREDEFLFTITFHDYCWDSTLTPAAFSPTAYTAYLFQVFTIPFTAAIDQTRAAACGGWTYELEYLSSGPLYSGGAPALTDFSITNTPSITGTISTRTWLGRHPLRLKCTLGVANVSPSARGNGGLFNSVNSVTFDYTLVDSCLMTIVNKNQVITEYQLAVFPGKSSEILTVNGPTDAVSVQFGNGYDKCGDMVYQLIGGNTYTDAYMKFNPIVNSGTVDNLAFQMQSYPGEGNEIIYKQNLEVGLQNYPAVPKATISVIFTYRECKPDLWYSFTLPQQLKKTQTIDILRGDTHSDIRISAQEFPCTFGQKYSAQLNTGRDIPDFLSFSSTNGVLKFATAEERHIGRYNVTLKAELGSQTNIVAETWFILIVSFKPYNVTLSRRPQFYMTEQDVIVGDKLQYILPDVYNLEGLKMKIKVSMNSVADQFLRFDLLTQRITTIDNKLSNEFAGVYTITVTAWLNDEFNKESYSQNLQITVTTNVLESVVVAQPPKQDKKGNYITSYKNIKEQKFIKMTSAKKGARNSRQPIPKIKSLSPEGVLKISWDRLMLKLDNVDEITESFIVVTDEAEANRIENERSLATMLRDVKKQDSRRLKKARDWFDTESEFLEYLLVMDALDIEVIPADEESADNIQFQWDLLSYQRDQIDIQLHFDYPDEISDDGNYDEIYVTFWGSDFFKSKDGEPVRYGEQVSMVILRQVDSDNANELERITTVFMSLFAVSFLIVLILLLAMGNSLLPVWIFITSLSLLVHTQLFNVLLSQDCLIIMKVMLKFMRLDFAPVEGNPLEPIYEDYSPPDMFQIAGYNSVSFLTNISYPFLIVLVLPVPLLILVGWKDICRECCCSDHQSWSPWVLNAYMRIVWILMLETSICAFLELRAHWITEETEADSPSLIISVVIMAFIAVLLLFMVGKLACEINCCKKKQSVKVHSGVILDNKGDVLSIKTTQRITKNHLDSALQNTLTKDIQHTQFKLNAKANAVLEDANEKDVNAKSSDFHLLWEEMEQIEQDLRCKIASRQKDIISCPQLSQVSEEVENEDESAEDESAEDESAEDESAEDESAEDENAEEQEDNTPQRIQSQEQYEGGSYVHSILLEGPKNDQTRSKQTRTLSLQLQAKQNVENQLEIRVHQNYATLYLGLWISTPALLYNLIYLTRCLLFAASATLTPEFTALQLMALQVPTLAMLVLLLRHKHNLLKDRIIYAQHLFNEIIIYFGSMSLVPLTNLVSDKEQREVIGWIFLGLIGANLIGNLVILIVATTHRARLLRLRCLNAGKKPLTAKVKASGTKVEDEPQSFTEHKLLNTKPKTTLQNDILGKVQAADDSKQVRDAEKLIQQESLELKEQKPQFHVRTHELDDEPQKEFIISNFYNVKDLFLAEEVAQTRILSHQTSPKGEKSSEHFINIIQGGRVQVKDLSNQRIKKDAESEDDLQVSEDETVESWFKRNSTLQRPRASNHQQLIRMIKPIERKDLHSGNNQTQYQKQQREQPRSQSCEMEKRYNRTLDDIQDEQQLHHKAIVREFNSRSLSPQRRNSGFATPISFNRRRDTIPAQNGFVQGLLRNADSVIDSNRGSVRTNNDAAMYFESASDNSSVDRRSSRSIKFAANQILFHKGK